MVDRFYLERLFFDQRHQDLAGEVDSWCRDVLPRLDVEALPLRGACRGLVAALGQHGLCRVSVGAIEDAPYGGLDSRSRCVVREGLARHSGLADFVFAMQGGGSTAITLFGGEGREQCRLPAVGQSAAVAAFAHSEAEAGSDVAAVQMQAEQIPGDGWRPNGAKSWISDAGEGNVCVVFARTGEGQGSKGISALVVPFDSPGTSVGKVEVVTAPHPVSALNSENFELPEDALHGRLGQGFAIAMTVLDIFGSSVGAAALGCARAALDAVLDYSTNRRIFGDTLYDLQLTQSRIGEVATGIDAATLLTYRKARVMDSTGARTLHEGSMAKLFATEMAHKVIDGATQLHGRRGVVRDSLSERLYREIWPLRIYEEATETKKIIIDGQVRDAWLVDTGEAL